MKSTDNLDNIIECREEELRVLKEMRENPICPGTPAYHKEYGFVIVGEYAVRSFIDQKNKTFESMVMVQIAFIDKHGSSRGQTTDVKNLIPISETLLKLRT